MVKQMLESSFGTPAMQRLARCPACGCSDLRPHLASEDYHYGNPGIFNVDVCSECELWVLSPLPDAKTLAGFYPQDYYSFEPPSLESGWKPRLRKLLGMRRETWVPAFPRPGTMLDVGCGAGQYLLEMRDRGWKVQGSELSRSAADAGRAAGLDIRGGELMDAGFPADSFDFVRLNHSFEHIPNPAAILSEIRRILKPAGKLFIGVPNAQGLWARLFGRYWWYLGLPVHTFSYNPKNIRLMLEANGFRVERLRFYSEFVGLMGSLQIFANRHRVPRSSDGPIVRSWLLRPFAQYLSRLLDLFRLGDCIEVIGVKAGNPRVVR